MAELTTATVPNPKPKSIYVLLLLTSILAHGILFSSRSVQPSIENATAKFEYATNTLEASTVGEDDDAVHDEQHQQQSQKSQLLRKRTPQQEAQPQPQPQPQPKEQEQEQLPHWRLATDCSSYSLDCFATARLENKYLSYPFSHSLRDDIELGSDDDDRILKLQKEWSLETTDRLSEDWIARLEKGPYGVANRNRNLPGAIEERNYVYPPTVPKAEYKACLDLAIHGNKTYGEQLDALLNGKAPRIVPEPDTNMVAFTISDYSYVSDMLHEVFQMMDETVGFSRKHFFLVAIDHASVELACKHGYPVMLWKADEGNLKNAVANTKVVLSHELVKRGVDFLFSEMDVWWIRSPKPNLVEFQSKHAFPEEGLEANGKEKNKDESSDQPQHSQQPHIYFSGHQNNYNAPNIGVYAVKADQYSEEYFRVCLDVLRAKPKTHDQWVLAEVYRLFWHRAENREYNLGGKFEPDGPPETPTIDRPFKAAFFSPHEVVADERPMPTHQTLAIHTLNNAPLQMPHGKKMVAKELGVFHGFRTNPQSSDVDGNGNGDASVSAGYYDRTGTKYRKYIWLDTDVRSNFYSIAHSKRYHDHNVLEWTMAILIAIARKTDRIFVLPQVFDADMDAGTYFPWNMVDYSKVTDMVDFRETNFPSNPKAWNTNSDWPFESVVNTALFESKDPDSHGVSFYTQVSDRSSVTSKKAWKAVIHHWDWLDAWIGALLAVPELDSAEILLVNPDVLMEGGKVWGMVHRLMEHKKQRDTNDDSDKEKNKHQRPPIGRMESEVLEIFELLGFCWDTGLRHTVSKVSASDSCYGIGTPKVY